MEISTKFVIEFSIENTTEIIAVCNSMSAVKEYLTSKFNFEDVNVNSNEGYLIVINLDCGKIIVRKVDFVED